MSEEEKNSTTGGSVSRSWFDHFKPRVNFIEIKFKKVIGRGAFGKVYKAKWNKRLVAVKKFEARIDDKAIETEVKQLSRVSHNNIINLVGTSSHQKDKYLVMEYADCGSLYTFLHEKRFSLYSTVQAISWARQCAEAVAYMHAMKPKPLIHRDLKSLNMLLTNGRQRLKVCDFGTVKDKSTVMTYMKGSPAWMAPEVAQTNNYDEKCDVYSWSILFWEIFTREIPFEEADNMYQIIWRVSQGERPPPFYACPNSINKFMKSCWEEDPKLRPSMQDVVSKMNELAAALYDEIEPQNFIFYTASHFCPYFDHALLFISSYNILRPIKQNEMAAISNTDFDCIFRYILSDDIYRTMEENEEIHRVYCIIRDIDWNIRME